MARSLMFVFAGLIVLAFAVAIGRRTQPTADPRNEHWRNTRNQS